MKIYTEVNYIWKDDKLVQTDSKSFDYEGEVDLCHWYHSHGGGTLNKVTKKVKETASGGAKKVKETVRKGLGGDIGKVVNKIYGGDTKAAVTSVQQTYKDFESGVHSLKDKMAQNTINQVSTAASDVITSSGLGNNNTNNVLGIYDARESLASSEAGGYKKKTSRMQSRGQMNLTGSSGRSILTS